MVKNILSISLVLLFTACANNTGKVQEFSEEYAVASTEENNSDDAYTKTQFVIANIVDSVLTANPDYKNNDIKEKKVAKEVQSAILAAIKQDHNVLTQIPLSFEMMMQKGNKYIIKFELSTIGNSGTKISNKYDIYFNVFTEMTEEEAAELVEKQKYHLSFVSISDVNNKLVLPSGRTFEDNPRIINGTLGEETSVCPGAFLLKGVKFSK